MQKLLTKDRWIILVSAIIVWTCTAFPSLWAIFQADAAAAYGITLEESAMLFPMCTAFFGIFSIVGPFVTDMFGNVNAGANMGIVSLYSTISSVVAPMLVTLFTPALGLNTSHIIGIVGMLLTVVCVVLLDPDTSKMKKAE